MTSPPGTAAEALEETAIGVNVKRRRLLGVKRTEPDEVVAALFERHVLPDKGRDVDASADLAKNALIVSHSSLKTSSHATEVSAFAPSEGDARQ